MKNPTLVQQLPPELAQAQCRRVFRGFSCGRSHLGRVRWVNEDAYLEHAEAQLWAVADGMGGLSRGDYASKAVVRALQDYQVGASLVDCLEAIQSQLNSANHICQNAFRGKRIGATIAALHIVGDHGLVVWAGDSRVYRWRQGQLQRLTRDHSLAEQAPEAADPQGRHAAHVLTRAVGVHRAVFPELNCQLVQADDRYLLCTDGAFSELSAHEISAAMQLSEPAEVLKSIESQALDHGGRDNITAVLVDVELAE